MLRARRGSCVHWLRGPGGTDAHAQNASLGHENMGVSVSGPPNLQCHVNEALVVAYHPCVKERTRKPA
eukprot:scaffold44662_cov72-Phaeocystis_antarctica.AAC.2